MNMSNITIDGQEMDLSQTMPSYAQVVSLYEDTSISVSSNETDKVLAGSLYTDTNEQGLTITSSLLKKWNEQTGKNLTVNDLIGKSVSASTAEASKIAQFQTKIVRIINDEDDMEDSNSFMLSHQMETISKEAGFTKAVSYFILELKDLSQTKVVTEELQKNKKYTVFSQQRVLDIVITFIRVIQGLLIVLSSQAIVVAAVMIGIIIYIIIYINIVQRSKEIGVMKAVGYQNRDVKGIFIYEAIWIVGIALLLAFLVAQGVGSLANAIVSHFYPSITKVFELNLLSVLGTLVFALLLGYVSAYFPARKISKMDPVESLRYE